MLRCERIHTKQNANDDDFHDYIVVINFGGVRGVEFGLLDDPVLYANIHFLTKTSKHMFHRYIPAPMCKMYILAGTSCVWTKRHKREKKERAHLFRWVFDSGGKGKEKQWKRNCTNISNKQKIKFRIFTLVLETSVG